MKGEKAKPFERPDAFGYFLCTLFRMHSFLAVFSPRSWRFPREFRDALPAFVFLSPTVVVLTWVFRALFVNSCQAYNRRRRRRFLLHVLQDIGKKLGRGALSMVATATRS